MKPLHFQDMLRLRRHGLFVLLVGLLVTKPLQAAGWVAVGPPGGDVRSLTVDPRDTRRIYLGTSNGVLYRSDDHARTWQRLSPGLPRPNQSLDEIVVDPAGVVYVGYWDLTGSGGGVARSTDGGRTFSILPGIDGQSVRALALAPSNRNVLVAGSNGGVFRSNDAGRTWQRISPEQSAEIRNLESLAIDPQNPDLIYVGTWHLPWKTADGGRTWQPISTGIIDDSDIFTINVDRRDPKVLFATACSGIYRSADDGGRWARIRGIPSSSRRTRAFAQDPRRAELMYAGTTEGLWVTDDDAVTWRLRTPKALVVNTVLALPDGTLLLGCDGAGVIRSSDGGSTWYYANQGFSERFVSRMAFDSRGSRVFAGIWGDRQYGGVFAASTPRGPWMRLGAGLEGREVLSIASGIGAIYAGTDDGLFLWSDATSRWHPLPALLNGEESHPRVADVAVLPGHVVLIATSYGVLRSADGGQTWQQPTVAIGGAVSALAASSRRPGLVAAATPFGLFRSEDSGETWAGISGMLSGSVHAMAFLPTNEAVLFVATSGGLFRSVDGGASWLRCAGGLPDSDITGLALHPDGQTVYASDFTWGGIFVSHNGGQSWSRVSANGLASERIWTLGIDPKAPGHLLAASRPGGLHLLALDDASSAGTASQ